MRSLLVFASIALFSGSVLAQNSLPLPAPLCGDNPVIASPAGLPKLKELLQPAPFCAGSCERDFDCMPGCSCHMSGRCM